MCFLEHRSLLWHRVCLLHTAGTEAPLPLAHIRCVDDDGNDQRDLERGGGGHVLVAVYHHSPFFIALQYLHKFVGGP